MGYACTCASAAAPPLLTSRGLGWWASSHIPIWTRSAEPFPSFSMAIFYDIHSLCSCTYHALHSTLRSIEIGPTHGRENMATHERKSFVKWKSACWDISLAKAWPRPLILTFLCYCQRQAGATTPTRNNINNRMYYEITLSIVYVYQ